MHDSENDHAILCYGNERTLITTRQRILEMIGIPVAIACSEEELAGHLSGLQVEVLLLCQTLSPQQCRRAAELVEQYSPSTKMLLMYNRYGKSSIPGSHVELNAAEGPLALLTTVKELLSDIQPNLAHSAD